MQNKSGWKSMFRRFSKSSDKGLSSAQQEQEQLEVAENERNETTMKLKLSPLVDKLEAGESSALISNFFLNDRLFKMLSGKTIALQTDVIFENQSPDGTPQSIIVSGKLPITISKETQDGKPLKVIRIKGHLRRKKCQATVNSPAASKEEVHQVDINNKGPAGDVEQCACSTKKEKQFSLKGSRVKLPPPDSSSGSEPLTSKRYPHRSHTRKKQKHAAKAHSNTASGVANWSPYFDLASQTGRLTEKATRYSGTDWELREKTPAPSPQESLARMGKDSDDSPGFLNIGGFNIPESIITSPEGKNIIQKLQQIAGMVEEEPLQETRGEAPKKISTAGVMEEESLNERELNPVTKITITRSRTRFFRYSNGIEYCEREGKQLLTVDAPEGLYFTAKPI